MRTHPFGWIEEPLSVRSSDFEISPMDDFDAAVSDGIIFFAKDDEWFDTTAVPKRFELPLTHKLTVDPSVINIQLAHLLISVFGFLHGLKLNPEEIGHLHKTPRRMGRLSNFTLPAINEVKKCLEGVIDFYNSHIMMNPNAIKLMEAGLHWHLTSQSYEHDFEIFCWQYMVLDNIHKVKCLIDPDYQKKMKRKGHAQRPVQLASRYGIVLHQAFSDCPPKKNAEALREHRNKLIHEAQWANRPLGYTVDRKSHDLTIALTWFNSQLILESLGIKCKFLSVDAAVLARSQLGII